MHCTTCNDKHIWRRDGMRCDYCGCLRATVRTHFGTGFGCNRYICSECIDAINESNTDFEGNWKGYVLDRFGRAVALLCGEAREELARQAVIFMRYGGGKMYASDDGAIEAICEIEEDHSLYGSVIGEWYYRNIVAVYGNERIYLVAPNGISEDAIYAYGNDARIAYAHENGEMCGNAKCEICFG